MWGQCTANLTETQIACPGAPPLYGVVQTSTGLRMCNRGCPSGFGVLRWATATGGGLAYCGTADATYAVADAAAPCYASPPPAPPVRVCVLPPTYSLATRVCPNGEAQLLPGLPARQSGAPAWVRLTPGCVPSGSRSSLAGGTYANFACSNGATPACASPLVYSSQYDVCVKSLAEPLCPPTMFQANMTARPPACVAYCPSGSGIRRVATGAGGSVAYCALADVGYDQAAAGPGCYTLPPPSPPAAPRPPTPPPPRVCSLPPSFSLPTRVCPNGEPEPWRVPAAAELVQVRCTRLLRSTGRRAPRPGSSAARPSALCRSPAGGTYANLACSNGATPACESPLVYYAAYDTCIKSLTDAQFCPLNHQINASRPLGCIPLCPSGAGFKLSVTSAGKTVSYCALVEVGYDVAANAPNCYAPPPPSPPPAPKPPAPPPPKVCSLPAPFSLPARTCPNGEPPARPPWAPLSLHRSTSTAPTPAPPLPRRRHLHQPGMQQRRHARVREPAGLLRGVRRLHQELYRAVLPACPPDQRDEAPGLHPLLPLKHGLQAVRHQRRQDRLLLRAGGGRLRRGGQRALVLRAAAAARADGPATPARGADQGLLGAAHHRPAHPQVPER